MSLNLLLFIPLFSALVCLFASSKRLVNLLNILSSTSLLIVGMLLSFRVFKSGAFFAWGDTFYFDALNAYLLLVIVSVSFLASLYSMGYIGIELAEKGFGEKKYARYFFWLYLFIFSMLIVASTNNLGLMWVGIEATTLSTALLVGFYHDKASLEAAWKYMLICSVGITFALFGTVLAYAAGAQVIGGMHSLNWTDINKTAGLMDPAILKLAFIFVLIGYGTKTGLVPMHTWLPDAHSQAPSPISAMLSGVLLNCALYAITRYHIIVQNSTAAGFSSRLLVVFGILSVALVVPFILIQHDFKRLLAYSSIEHMGIITTAIGFGSQLALVGAFLHLFNHALTKSLMFFSAGNIMQKFKTKQISRIKGTIKALPVTGTVLVLGYLSITGVPPFGIFTSEFTIVSSGFLLGHTLLSSLMLLLTVLIFSGFTFYISKMVMGSASGKLGSGELSLFNSLILLVPLAFVLILGLYLPSGFRNVLEQVAMVVGGGK